MLHKIQFARVHLYSTEIYFKAFLINTDRKWPFALTTICISASLCNWYWRPRSKPFLTFTWKKKNVSQCLNRVFDILVTKLHQRITRKIESFLQLQYSSIECHLFSFCSSYNSQYNAQNPKNLTNQVNWCAIIVLVTGNADKH